MASDTKSGFSRRAFAVTAAGLAAGVRGAQGAAPSARDIVTSLQSAAGAPPPNSADNFLAGDPDVAVKGIATTAMATMDVLKQAAKSGLNLIITYEGVYYGQPQPA